MYMSSTKVFLLLLRYFPLQTRLYSPQHATYNASVQEFAIWYRQVSDTYVPPKNGSGRWVAFVLFSHFAVQTSLNNVQPTTDADRR